MKFLFDDDHYPLVIEQGILCARSFIWIATANLKDLHIVSGGRSHPLLDDLARKAGGGVCIRILYGAEPSSRFKHSFDEHENLISGGIELQPCARLHAKLVLVDNVLAYLGSANLTGAGLGAKSAHTRNFEAGVLTNDTSRINDLMEYFDRIWRGDHCPQCKRRDECVDPIV
ncbi:MAG: hypothetical protein A2487_17565 [Candidatus Raymondbacteria bacterium RifOxyC12_full_50_8]|uniref:PLD phosphodiesterase domain-containing protein n=1 Tax=Candidatus Raymondbacteria bacterium RIFOXYD12_FULL_49_13 TaxID=1817890 RepID=A0A1F7FCR0_UNCRA|nr:MAG: hypothetical protein A2248_02950 [Candidatus Raymondbacteria bacterium RIFOXYA2_FULL_49_16]OGJ94217.1 MAG: hypothetical protein A2487_17565 [Candidatus Raymondbacteria bacterium RifOxyC12_full_50_8]OGK03159.1 MAG: hypothetical protein A2350_15085 [Candidatus Raymondbacteria bacterium RifOxyB12_full_50_8]OGK04302.1 MAG: hypothetical protein A2519_18260 [Candidatus Raymondbacteria bacterium RIFOXYD12_FULL_49_13]OGP42415.1 MAG: hypothetical protein A2324_16985 [Candidatus Raymondbacteria b